MVDCVLEDGWTIEATAERFQVDAKTVRKWRDRFVLGRHVRPRFLARSGPGNA
jgi:transposase-like protein